MNRLIQCIILLLIYAICIALLGTPPAPRLARLAAALPAASTWSACVLEGNAPDPAPLPTLVKNVHVVRCNRGGLGQPTDVRLVNWAFLEHPHAFVNDSAQGESFFASQFALRLSFRFFFYFLVGIGV